MKKYSVIILAIVLVLSCFCISFGSIPSDVQGTKYENAVNMLIDMNILNGYGDNTYRPDNTISRAEMATIIVRTMATTSYEELMPIPFNDLEGHWAEQFVTIAYSTKIINGIAVDLFAPDGKVTYEQAATMLIRALGYTDEQLGGTWPANYLQKGAELGLFNETEIKGGNNQPATRGDIALMTVAVAQNIRRHWTDISQPEEPQDNGKLADFNGRAIGIPLSIGSELNEDGKAVDEVEFLMGDYTYYLNTSDLEDVSVSDFKTDGKFTGELYAARMREGILKSIQVASAETVTRCIELTESEIDGGAFREITQDKNRRLSINGADLSNFGYAEEVVCYEAVFDGNDIETFKFVSTSEIEVGDYVRAWDLDSDYAGVAIVMVLIDKDDIAAAVEYGIVLI